MASEKVIRDNAATGGEPSAAEARISCLSHLMDAAQEIAMATDIDELLAKVTRAACDVTDSEQASILLLDEERSELYFRKSAGNHGEILERIRFPVNENSFAGWSLLNRKPLIVNDVGKDTRHYKEVDRLTTFTTHTLLAVPIVYGDGVFGVIEVLNRRAGEYDPLDVEYLGMLSAQAGVALNNVNVVAELQNFFAEMVEVIIAAVEMIDPPTRGHVVRVARLATSLARELGLPARDLEQVLYGAYFHEVGRLLSETARSGARTRDIPIVGAQLLEKIKMLKKVAPIVRSHRERYDGSGFPEGLKGEEIPLGAQILGLAVDYDEQFVNSMTHMPLHVFQKWFFESVTAQHNPRLLEVFRRQVVVPMPSGAASPDPRDCKRSSQPV